MATLKPVDYDPFAPASGPKLTPVDNDPFATEQSASPSLKLTPVEHDPFAESGGFVDNAKTLAATGITALRRGVLSTGQMVNASRAGSLMDAAELARQQQADEANPTLRDVPVQQNLPATLDTGSYAEADRRRLAEAKPYDTVVKNKTTPEEYVARARANLIDLAKKEAEIKKLPAPKVVQDALQSKTFGEFWTNFKKAPATIITSIGFESAPLSLGIAGATAVGGATAGVPGAMALTGAVSSAVEYTSSITDALREEGVDFADPASVEKALADDKLMARVEKRASARALPVGALDAVTAGIASKVLIPARMAERLAAAPVRRELTNLVPQMGAQAVGGAAGEAGAQLASGQDWQPGAIAAEAAGELVTTPADVVAASLARGERPVGEFERVLREIDGKPAPAAAGGLPTPEGIVPAQDIPPPPPAPPVAQSGYEAMYGEAQAPAAAAEAPAPPSAVSTVLQELGQREGGKKSPLGKGLSEITAGQKGGQAAVDRVAGVQRESRATAIPVGEPVKITTPDDSAEIEARPVLVELDTLKPASGKLQPRDRARVEMVQEAKERAVRLDPARLMPDRVSDAGAPIVTADGTVISGNGRMLSIAEVYSNPALRAQANAYKAALPAEAQGMSKPVLVMQSQLSGLDAERFAQQSNRPRIATLSATEQANTDAAVMGDILDLYQGGDFEASANAPFLKAFATNVVASSERNSFSKDGQLSAEGMRRMQGAILARAYGETGLLSRMLESTDDNVRAIVGALQDAAPQMAALRKAVQAGQIMEGLDPLPDISAAVSLISDMRKKRLSPAKFFRQMDAFTEINPDVAGWVLSLYNPADPKTGAEAGEHALSRPQMAAVFRAFANEAMQHKTGGFFDDETTRADILSAVGRNAAQGTALAEASGASPSDGSGGTANGQAQAGGRGPQASLSNAETAASAGTQQGQVEALGRREAYKRLKSGGDYAVPPATVYAVLDALRSDWRIVPAGTRVGIVEAIEPFVDPTAKVGEEGVKLTLRQPNGQLHHRYYLRSFVLRAHAFFDPEVNALIFVRLGEIPRVGKEAAAFSKSLRGELRHELLHLLRANKIITGAQWDALVSHARRLQVLRFSQRSFALLTGKPVDETTSNSTLQTLYTNHYRKNKKTDKEIQAGLEEESVTHMLELAYHGKLNPREIDPIQPFIDKMELGLYGRGAQSVGTEVMASLHAQDDLSPLGFYSTAMRAANGLKQAKGTPEQMLAQLKTAGVKDSEIKATGLDRFLSDRKSITKDEITSYLAAHAVEVREVVYAGDKAFQPFAGGSQYDRAGAERPAKWKEYALDGSNPTYSETVLHLPGNGPAMGQTLTIAERKAAEEGWAKDFHSGHWSEPNVLSHVRSSVHKDEAGRSVFLIDELQSDWGQKVRDGKVRDEAKIADLKQKIAEAEKAKDAALAKTKPGDIGNAMLPESETLRRLRAELDTALAGAPPHPLVSTTDQWVQTSLRRILMKAVEAGADAVSFTPGRVQAERYSLGGHVDELMHIEHDGFHELHGQRNGESVFFKEGLKESELADYIGKSLSEKLLASPKDEEGFRHLTGVDLELGGEGMRATYDSIYPKTLAKILGKFDKTARPQYRKLKSHTGQFLKDKGGKDIEFITFPLTEVSKEKIGSGMPMFSLSPSSGRRSVEDILIEEAKKSPLWPSWGNEHPVRAMYSVRDQEARQAWDAIVQPIQFPNGVRVMERWEAEREAMKTHRDLGIAYQEAKLAWKEHEKGRPLKPSELVWENLDQLPGTPPQSDEEITRAVMGAYDPRPDLLKGVKQIEGPRRSNRPQLIDRTAEDAVTVKGPLASLAPSSAPSLDPDAAGPLRKARDSALEFLQDAQLRVRRLVERANEPLPDDADPYMAATLYHGRLGGRAEAANQQAKVILQGANAIAKATNSPLENVKRLIDLYLVAKHAPERNAVHGDGSAGITNAEATAALARISALPQSAEIIRVAGLVQDMNRQTLKTLLDGRVISQETFDLLSTTYANHVPLNRILPEGDEEIAAVLAGGGFDVRGTGLQRARGSKLPIAPILENVLLNHEQAIVRAEKNTVDLATLAFVRRFEDDLKGQITILGGPKPARTIDAAERGIRDQIAALKKMLPKDDRPHHMDRMPTKSINDPRVLELREDGERVLIRFRDPKLAAAFKATNSEKMPKVLYPAMLYTRVMSQLATRFNPEFAPPNKIRDIQETAVYIAAQKELGFKGAAKFALRELRGENYKAIVDWMMGRDTPGARLYQEMIDEGGTTGGLALSSRDRVQESIAEIEKLVTASPANIRKVLKATAGAFDNLNKVFEDSTRLSAYRSAKARGLTKKRAAVHAKEASINFNRMGTAGHVINGLWMFSNASIQGTTKMIRAMKNPKVAGVVVLGMAAAVTAVGEWNDQWDEKWREKVTKWDRLNSLVFVLPSSTPDQFNYVSIPVSWGLKPILNMMNYTYDAEQGIDWEWGDFLRDMTTSTVEAANPLGGTTLTQALVPTALDLPVDIATNQSWSGSKIKPDPQRGVPEDVRYFLSLKDKTSGQASIAATEALVDSTGIAISPADVNYAIEQLVGGVGRTAGRVVTTAQAVIEGKVPEKDQFPFLSRFYRRREGEEIGAGQGLGAETREVRRIVEQQGRERIRRKYEIEGIFEEIKQLPKDEIKKRIASEVKKDPASLDIFKGLLESEAKGLTGLDKQINLLGVENGERARYYFDRLKEASPDERRSIVEDGVKKGLISRGVIEQIGVLNSLERLSPEQRRKARDLANENGLRLPPE